MPQLTITEVRNVKSSSPDNSTYSLEINHPVDCWTPYKINARKEETTIDEDKLLATIGTDFSAYVAPTAEEIATALAASERAKRDSLLASDVDPIAGNALRWAALTDSERTAWTNYRTALLDVPAQAGFPSTITWPTKP